MPPTRAPPGAPWLTPEPRSTNDRRSLHIRPFGLERAARAPFAACRAREQASLRRDRAGGTMPPIPPGGATTGHRGNAAARSGERRHQPVTESITRQSSNRARARGPHGLRTRLDTNWRSSPSAPSATPRGRFDQRDRRAVAWWARRMRRPCRQTADEPHDARSAIARSGPTRPDALAVGESREYPFGM